MKSRGGNALNHRFSFRQNLFLEDWNDWAENSSRLQVIYFYRGSWITLISSDGTRYVRPFVIFRDCIQKVVQFTEPAVINYGLCGKFRAPRTDRFKMYFFQCSRIIITSWVSNDRSSTLRWYWIHPSDITWQTQHATEQIYDVWIFFAKFPVFRLINRSVQIHYWCTALMWKIVKMPIADWLPYSLPSYINIGIELSVYKICHSNRISVIN